MKWIGIIIAIIGLFLIVNPAIKLQTVGVVFSDDFESDLSQWLIIEQNGTVQLTQENVHLGEQAVKCVMYSVSVTEWAYARLKAELSTHYQTLYLRSWVDVTELSGDYDVTLLSLTGEVLIASLRVTPDMYLSVFVRDGDTYKTFTSSSKLSGGWQGLVLMATVGEGTGQVKVFLNDMEITDLSINGLNNSIADSVFRFSVGLSGTSTSCTAYFDDVVVSTEYVSTTEEIPSEPPPTITYSLTVNSQPVSGITYTLDSQPAVTGETYQLEEGIHTIEMPSTVDVEGETYLFSEWDDGLTSPQRTLQLSSDMTLTAIYTVAPPPPSPTQGTLEIHAFVDETEVNAEITINGVGTYWTGADGVTINLEAGTYTVKATYQSQQKTANVTITAGEVSRLDFHFQNATALTPPPEPFITPTETEGSSFTIEPTQIIGAVFLVVGIVMVGKGGGKEK